MTSVDFWRRQAAQATSDFEFNTAVLSCWRSQLDAVAAAFGFDSGLAAVEAFRVKYLNGRSFTDSFTFFENYFSDAGWEKSQHRGRLGNDDEIFNQYLRPKTRGC